MPTPLLTTAEVAQRFGVHVATVNRWAAAGKLPVALRLPGKRGDRLYDPKVIARFDRAA